MRNSKEIDQRAIYWYVQLQSPEFSSEQEADFFKWLESSSAHQAAFIRAEQAWSAGKVIGTLQATPASRNLYFVYFGGAAAALFTCFLLILFITRTFSVKNIQEHYTTLQDQQRAITLADGSSVTMHTNTSISVRYDVSHREIDLNRGQIFLQVKTDPQRPFYVTTRRGKVQVIGTQFAVDQLNDDFRVTVVEGRVGIFHPDEPGGESSAAVVLTANQQILLSNALAGESAIAVNASRETSWTKGRMIFDGTPLAEVVTSINPYLDLPISIDGSELREKRIVGAISVKNSRTAAASLASITGAKVEDTEDKKGLKLKPTSNGSLGDEN